MAAHEPPHEAGHRQGAKREQAGDRLATLLPDQDAEHNAAHPDDRERCADRVELAGAGVRHVAHQLDAREDDRDHDNLEKEADPPGKVGRDEPSQEGPDRRGDRGSGADQGVDPRLCLALEVAVDERLHAGQQQGGPQPAEDRPEDDDRGQALGKCHCERADRVAEEPEHIGALATEEIADLAADQDERRGHQRFERNRGLHPAHGRIEVLDHRRDRDVHERRVDDEDEHRHRQQERQLARVAGQLAVRR